MAEKWTIVKKPFEREIVREVEYGIFANNGKELVANVTSRKDAQLIAASPRMLAALQLTLTWMRDDLGLDDDSPEVAPVIAAIKAAKGE